MNIGEAYPQILREELILAMGCTEPIAIAYAAAIARDELGVMPERVLAECSGNVIKNVKSVVIPNTGGLRGVEAAAVAGTVAGKREKRLEVISEVDEEQKQYIKELVHSGFCQVACIHGEANLCINITCYAGEHQVSVRIMHTHTNVTRILKDGQSIFEKPCDSGDFNSALTDRTCLTVEEIVRYADQDSLDGIKSLIEDQIHYNIKIAEEGMNHAYGARIGKVLDGLLQNDYTHGIAYASAASDARMSGCQMAVMTNSGSGNQGITASLPVIIFAREHQCPEEQLLRALVISNLITVHIKTGIGRLSAYCGVICAAGGAFAGISYLEGYGVQVISEMLQNHLGTISGMVCDGAKESCASKISTSLFSAMLGYQMAKQGIAFGSDCGILQDHIEKTIDIVGVVGREGMRETDQVILDIMTK